MALASGTRLGVYEILTLLGTGGMGEVYRALDTRLHRTVAIKVLPETLASSAEFRARFEHEARTIARLDHPNICAVYDIGEHAGVAFLVMQYLEGETLADRLKQGPMVIEQALRYAIDIARALDEAHRHHGVTHRDLKPANVMLTRSGAKLLDFGLAIARGPAVPLSLTIMTQMGAAFSTAPGTILGTVQYMSPEQLEGREADIRSDIFAFGATMYEMVTGRRAFEGEVPAAVIGSILKDNPPPASTLCRSAPRALDHVISTCLAKAPDERWQSAGDIQRQLVWILGGGRETEPPQAITETANRKPKAFVLAAVLSVALGAGSALAVRQWMTSPPESPVLRFSVTPPENATFANANALVTAAQFAVSPDGHQLVTVATPAGGRPALWVRSLDTLPSRLLPGTEDAEYPFWSPDSRFIGFFAQGKLKKIDLHGGLPLTLCDASSLPRGGAWNRDGIILFAPDATSGLLQVSAEGGPSRPAVSLLPGETSHRWPSFLPDGGHFVMSVRGERRGVYVGSLGSSARTRVLDGQMNALYASGHLLTVQDGFLLAYPFDEKRLQVAGRPVRLAETVGASSALLAAMSVSNSGVLAYSQGLASPPGQLMWFDRQGTSLGPPATEAGHYMDFRFSPDGKRLATTRIDPTTSNADIWLMDVARGVPIRFTSDPATDVSPIWSGDGKRIVFRSDRAGVSQLFEKPSAGGGGAERLLSAVEAWFPTDWSPDGKFIVYHAPAAATRFDLMLLPQSGDHKPIALGHSAFNESGGRVSPDGEWIAYVSDVSGRTEVYVRSFPRADEEWRISTGGGSEPRWRRDGRELFYLDPGGVLMSVVVRGTTTFENGAPQRLFQTHTPILGSLYRSNYDVAGDGRFLVNTTVAGGSSAPITIIVNWPDELKRLASAE